MRFGHVRFQSHGFPPAGQGFGRATRRAIDNSQVREKTCCGRLQKNRVFDVLDRLRKPTGLVMQHAEQVPGLGILCIFRQRLPV